MALRIVEEGHPETVDDHFNRASLRLVQAKALTEMLGEAVQYGTSSDLPAADAASGIVALLEQAHVSLIQFRQGRT